MALQHLRSSTANKRPLPAGMSDGQLAINTNAASPGVFFKTSTGVLVKAGPVHVGTTAPNSSPASGGETGNTTGELWLDTSLTPNELKTWDGSAWVSATGQEIPVSKLIDGSARQLLQTDAAGTGVEWTSDVDVPGTLDVTSTATFDGRIYTILGSASTPAISPATDTNTGIAFSGTEAVNIVSNATTILSVEKDNATADVQVTGKISSTNTSAASAFIPTGTTVPTNGLYLPTTNSVALSTNGTERLRITSTGLVGVGTSAPSDLLHLAASGSNTAAMRLQSGDGRTYLVGSTGTGYGITGKFIIYDSTAGAERFCISSSGLVGIGTSSPSALLHVQQSADGEIFRVQRSGGTNLPILRFNLTEATPDAEIEQTGAVAGAIGFKTGATRRMTITSAGNVGIGTTSPSSELHVQGTLSGGQLLVASSSTNSAEKYGTLGTVHYTNAEEPALGLAVQSNSTDNNVLIGGALGEFNAATSVRFYTAANNTTTTGSERARIDSSGRLLVGTSSASTTLGALTAKFQIAGTSVFDTGISTALFENSNNPAQLQLVKSRNATTGGQTVVQANDTLGRILFGGSDGTAYQTSAWIQAEVDGTPGTNDMPGRLVFSTTADGASSPTERMRINQSGAIGSFATSLDANIYLSNAATAGVSTPLLRGRYGATGMYGGTDSIYIWSNGNIQNTNNSYTAISDIKLKENVVDAGSQWADIKALRVRKYNLKEGQTHTQIGLIAQEVEPVSPGLVYETPDRDADGNDLGTTTKAVQYSVLYMKAVKALQEAMERIETLEADVAALKAS